MHAKVNVVNFTSDRQLVRLRIFQQLIGASLLHQHLLATIGLAPLVGRDPNRRKWKHANELWRHIDRATWTSTHSCKGSKVKFCAKSLWTNTVFWGCPTDRDKNGRGFRFFNVCLFGDNSRAGGVVQFISLMLFTRRKTMVYLTVDLCPKTLVVQDFRCISHCCWITEHSSAILQFATMVFRRDWRKIVPGRLEPHTHLCPVLIKEQSMRLFLGILLVEWPMRRPLSFFE